MQPDSPGELFKAGEMPETLTETKKLELELNMGHLTTRGGNQEVFKTYK